jgi:hypothetical protein
MQVGFRFGRAVGAGEFGLGLAIILVPGSVSGFLVGSLGIAFAGLGLYARKTNRSVVCNCVGFSGGDHTLGNRQVLLLPVWLLAAAAPMLRVPRLIDHHRLEWLSIVLFIVTALAVVTTWSALAPHRQRRRQVPVYLSGAGRSSDIPAEV